MTQTAYFSETIRPVLLREINAAKQSIYVAAAWFTDYELFSALLTRQRAGISVAVMIDDNDINDDASIPFHELSQAGGQFWAMTGVLMHHKFCVFDTHTVITGSYNWTYRAATENQENILLTTNNPDLAQQYIREFLAVTGQDTGETTVAVVNRILYRLKGLLTNIVELEAAADFGKQADRLIAESDDSGILSIANALHKRQYGLALERIDDFTNIKKNENINTETITLQEARREVALSWLEQGIAALYREDDKAADKYLTKSLTLCPDLADAYAYRALSRRNISNEPLDWDSMNSSGFQPFFHCKGWDDLKVAEKLNPNCAAAIPIRMILLEEKFGNGEQDDHDIKELTRAITLDPNCVIAYFWRGYKLQRNTNYKEAIADFDVTIKYSYKSALSFQHRGFSKYKQGNLQGARADYKKAIQLGRPLEQRLQRVEGLIKAAELERQANQQTS